MSPTAVTPAKFPWFDYRRYTFSLGLDLGDKAVLSGHSASTYDPAEERIAVRGGMAEQASTAYDKIEAILEAAGYGLDEVVRVVENVTKDGISDYAEAEEVRTTRLAGARPAVSTLCVDRLLRPAALIEIAVTVHRGGANAGPVGAGVPGFTPARGADGVVYLPSVLPVDEAGQVQGRDLHSQTEAAFDRAERLLAGVGLTWSNVAKTLDFSTPATLADYKATARIRRERLGPVYPAAAGILMSRLAHPDALVQLDLIASTEPLHAVNPGWGRYDRLTYSPAVRAGNVIFLSGQAALDPEAETAVHTGDVAAQAAYIYENIIKVLEAAGAGPQHLVETVEYVTPAGLRRYREVAAIREQLLVVPYPASTGIVCNRLLRPEFEIEIDPLAVLPSGAGT